MRISFAGKSGKRQTHGVEYLLPSVFINKKLFYCLYKLFENQKNINSLVPFSALLRLPAPEKAANSSADDVVLFIGCHYRTPTFAIVHQSYVPRCHQLASPQSVSSPPLWKLFCFDLLDGLILRLA